MIKYLIVTILLFCVHTSTAQFFGDSIHNPFAPVKIFSGERIALTEDSVKKILIDTNAHIIDGYRVYYDSIGEEYYTGERIMRIYQFSIKSNDVEIETDLGNGKLHGFYYLKRNNMQVIRLYDRDSMICEALIKNGKILLEYIQNGNIYTRRVYNKKGEIIYESIKFDICSEWGRFYKKDGVIKYKKQTFSDYCRRDIVNLYSYLNYPPLEWLKSFSGIDPAIIKR